MFYMPNCDISREYSIIFWFQKSQYLFPDFCRKINFHNNNQNICFSPHYVNQLIHMLFHVDNVDNFVYNLIFQRFSRFQKVENFSHTNSPIHISKKNLCNLLISTYYDTQPLKISYLQYPAKYRQIPLPHTFFPCNSMIKKGPGNSSQSYKRIYLNRLCPKAMPLFFYSP